MERIREYVDMAVVFVKKYFKMLFPYFIVFLGGIMVGGFFLSEIFK